MSHMTQTTGEVRTSIHYGSIAVEDQPALVQSRDSVQEVEGPQVPLIPAVKARQTSSVPSTHRSRSCRVSASLNHSVPAEFPIV